MRTDCGPPSQGYFDWYHLSTGFFLFLFTQHIMCKLSPCCSCEVSWIQMNIDGCWERQTSNIGHTLVGNKIVDRLDVVGGVPVGTAPTTSSFWINTWLQWTEQRQLQHETRNIEVLGFGVTYIRDFMASTGFRRWGITWSCPVFNMV